jgi:hypothetical protein
MKRSITTMLLIGALAHSALAEADDNALGGDGEQPACDPASAQSGDLAQAADATAEVAAVTSLVSTPSTPKASSNEIDLSSLGLDEGGFDDKLNIFGFADFNYTGIHWVRKNPPTTQKDTHGFLVGKLNIYLLKNLTAKTRALVEVKFSFMPNASQNPDGSYISTLALDASNLNRPASWGSTTIERAYIEYDVTDYLTIRAGHWLTPYGIWNIDHGSPVVINVLPPYIIGELFFPEHQTGLDLFGHLYAGRFQIEYHLTGSNGHGAAEAQLDLDNELAYGARVAVETPWGLKLGGSYYRGKYTGFPARTGALPDTYREAAYGADLQYRNGGLLVQSEAIARERHYSVGARAASGSGFAADGRDLGFYLQAGYRFDVLWNVMPFAMYQDYKPADYPYFSRVKDVQIGLNFRPSANVVYKLELARVRVPEDDPKLLAGMKDYLYFAQAAWVF